MTFQGIFQRKKNELNCYLQRLRKSKLKFRGNLQQTEILIFRPYLSEDGRVPPAYFPTSQFCQDAFLRDESFFLQNTLLIFSKFYNFKKFLLFRQTKTSQLS